MSDAEMQFCRDAINNAIGDNFNFIKCEVEEVEDAKSYDGERVFRLKIVFDDERTRRDSNGQCFIPKYMCATIRKEKGYDQAEVGAFYTWEDGFKPNLDKTSYSCKIDLIGHYRGYRCKRVNTWVGITGTYYTFGTELTDLHIGDGVNIIRKYLRSSEYSKVPLNNY